MFELSDKYIIKKKLGKGSFGEVYVSLMRATNKYIALKVEEKYSKTRIINEYKIYQELNRMNISGIPLVYEFLTLPRHYVMSMQLLGDCIDKYEIESERELNNFAYQIISIIQNLHSIGYIHRDIKPNNFLFDVNNQIYLIDFGLSAKYVDDEDNHFKIKKQRPFIGTLRYASVNVHMGIEPSRRDDMISIGYMLIFLLEKNLPWMKVKYTNKKDRHEKVKNIKMMCSLDNLTQNKKIKEYLEYCSDLIYDDEPDYDYLLSLFAI